MPSGSTASKPSTRWRITPLRKAITPPALVDTMPPRVAEPRAARSMPGSSWCSAAASCSACSVQPAPTSATRSVGSMGSIWFRRKSESTIWPGFDMLPPTRPVRPACGTRLTPCCAHRRTTAATSGVLAGDTTMPASRLCGFQPTSSKATASPVATWAVPTAARRAAINSEGTADIATFFRQG